MRQRGVRNAFPDELKRVDNSLSCPLKLIGPVLWDQSSLSMSKPKFQHCVPDCVIRNFADEKRYLHGFDTIRNPNQEPEARNEQLPGRGRIRWAVGYSVTMG